MPIVAIGTTVLRRDGTPFPRVRRIVISLPLKNIATAEVTYCVTNANGRPLLNDEQTGPLECTERYAVEQVRLGKDVADRLIELGHRIEPDEYRRMIESE